ncbi:hypothetical protein DUI87_19200 [Hirundo rustica rustica]|uniref:Peptidase A2 domain-containing protein n=1 Tax=Hirundo rustica rustica TaxID=333673 RepID=A0A3M0JU91_HIRRU|nr:hypothetical protein DUI87_19200 [Hirundo rustica rustica]
MSVRERFVHRERMQEQHHRMHWKTLEEGIQNLREVAVLEVLFGRGGQHDNDPNKVRCTGQMLWNLATLGPSQYATFIATINADNNRETVGSVVNKLRNYESMISGPMQAQVSVMVKELREEMREMREEMREEMRRNSSHVAPVRVTGPRVRAQHPPDRDRGYSPQTDLWFFLRDHGEDMGRWDGKPTSALAARVRELKERNTNRGGPTKMKVASTSHDQAARYYRSEDDMSDPCEGTSTMCGQEGNNDQCKRGPASSQGEARGNRVFWTVWIRWPGASEPQKYEALVDTGSQCTLMPLGHVGTEPISIARVTGGSQELTLLEAKVSLTGKEWQKHPIVTGPGAPCILGIDFLRNGYYKDSKGLRWAFGIAAVEAEGIKKLNSLPGLSEKSSAVGLLKVEEQQVPVATLTVHCRQYRTNRDAVIPIHKMIRELESQGVVSKTHSPFNSPIWPVRKSDGEWRWTVDYRALNEVTPPLSIAVPDMLELQYELESKATKWYATIDIANAFFLHSSGCRMQASVCFHLEGRAVHLEPTAPGVETQPHHLPWTDPGCTGKG